MIIPVCTFGAALAFILFFPLFYSGVALSHALPLSICLGGMIAALVRKGIIEQYMDFHRKRLVPFLRRKLFHHHLILKTFSDLLREKMANEDAERVHEQITELSGTKIQDVYVKEIAKDAVDRIAELVAEIGSSKEGVDRKFNIVYRDFQFWDVTLVSLLAACLQLPIDVLELIIQNTVKQLRRKGTRQVTIRHLLMGVDDIYKSKIAHFLREHRNLVPDGNFETLYLTEEDLRGWNEYPKRKQQWTYDKGVLDNISNSELNKLMMEMLHIKRIGSEIVRRIPSSEIHIVLSSYLRLSIT